MSVSSDLDDEDMPLEERIYHLRVGGLSITEVAKRTGVTRIEAATLFQRFMVELSKASALEDRDATLQLELDRLDRLHDAYWHSATSTHEAMVQVGKGADAYMEKVEVDPDKDAAKLVLEISKQRAKLAQLETLPPGDATVVANVLVLGNDTAAFIESLRAGREQHTLTSGHQDNEVVEGTVEAEMEVS